MSDVFTSVWEGRDGELLDKMIAFYLPGQVVSDTDILDTTYNEGRIWQGSSFSPVKMDIDPSRSVDYCCDNREMPGVPDGKFKVVVYDPPHVGNNGRDKSTKQYDTKFGASVRALKEEGYTLSFLYPPFLQQAKRVMQEDGVLFAKITDQVNNHRSRWAHLDFMIMAAAAGFTVCDLIVKVRKGPMMSSKWNKMHHARKRHCFWIVLRNSDRCETGHRHV